MAKNRPFSGAKLSYLFNYKYITNIAYWEGVRFRDKDGYSGCIIEKTTNLLNSTLPAMSSEIQSDDTSRVAY